MKGIKKNSSIKLVSAKEISEMIFYPELEDTVNNLGKNLTRIEKDNKPRIFRIKDYETGVSLRWEQSEFISYHL